MSKKQKKKSAQNPSYSETELTEEDRQKVLAEIEQALSAARKKYDESSQPVQFQDAEQIQGEVWRKLMEKQEKEKKEKEEEERRRVEDEEREVQKQKIDEELRYLRELEKAMLAAQRRCEVEFHEKNFKEKDVRSNRDSETSLKLEANHKKEKEEEIKLDLKTKEEAERRAKFADEMRKNDEEKRRKKQEHTRRQKEKKLKN